jgi:hypothetical protein
MGLKTELASREQVQGNFTLILHRGPWPQNVGHVAFLDRDDDRITFEPYAAEFDYTTIKGITAKEAIARAEEFVSGHSSFHRTQLSCIRDEYERIIGYEIRPLYLSTTYGMSDVLTIHYRLINNKVMIHVNIDPEVDRRISS